MMPSLSKRAITTFQNRYLTFTLRIILGGMFLFAGAIKLSEYTDFVGVVIDYEILSPSIASVYGYSLPWVEIVIGLLLVLGILLRPAATLSILTTVSFTTAKIVNLYRGRELICGCFGEGLNLLISQSLFIDVLMLAMAFQILFHRGEFLSLSQYIYGKAMSDRR